MVNTGGFADNCKDCKMKAQEDKNWVVFKTFFLLIRQEWRESQGTQAGRHFPTANVATRYDPKRDRPVPAFEAKTLNAIPNFATSAANNQAAISNLSATIANLTTKITATNAKLVLALGRVASRNKPPRN